MIHPGTVRTNDGTSFDDGEISGHDPDGNSNNAVIINSSGGSKTHNLSSGIAERMTSCDRRGFFRPTVGNFGFTESRPAAPTTA